MPDSQTSDSRFRCQIPDSQMPDVIYSVFFCRLCLQPSSVFFIKKQTLLADSGCRRKWHWNLALFRNCRSSLLATGNNLLDAGRKLKLSVSSLPFECTQV